jgi:hypothetical protein
MKIEDAIAALKEFFLDVLGFLLPGYFVLILFYLFLVSNFKICLDKLLVHEYSKIIIPVISYIAGYVLFGISEAWNSLYKLDNQGRFFKILCCLRFLEKKHYTSELHEKIKESADYKIVKQIINERIGIENQVLDNMDANSVRNIAMSYIPEADKKIYNFMFRSELSDKINVSLKIIVFLGVISLLFELMFQKPWLLKTDTISLHVYMLFFISTYFLRKTQKRFFSIAFRIAFPIFVVKYKMLGGKNIE